MSEQTYNYVMIVAVRPGELPGMNPLEAQEVLTITSEVVPTESAKGAVPHFLRYLWATGHQRALIRTDKGTLLECYPPGTYNEAELAQFKAQYDAVAERPGKYLKDDAGDRFFVINSDLAEYIVEPDQWVKYRDNAMTVTTPQHVTEVEAW
jgi:hypothetical protein